MIFSKSEQQDNKLERFVEALAQVKTALILVFYCAFCHNSASHFGENTLAKILAATILACISWPLSAQDSDIPRFFAVDERLERPDISRLGRLRFLTTVDFPPFNYLDNNGNLSGYHIDLARNICFELQLTARCQIEAAQWDELPERIKNGEADVVMAGLAATAKTRDDFAFSHAYMYFPARFIGLVEERQSRELSSILVRTKTGIVKNTAHEKMFAAYFPANEAEIFADYGALFQALREKKISLAFGDGLRFSLWLASPTDNECCHFVGGAYYGMDYLGSGLRLAILSLDKSQNREQSKIMLNALNYALQSLEQQGKLKELYLRYFPVGFY